MHLFLQIEQLQSLAEESQMLKDEMDVLRHSQEKVVSYYLIWFLHMYTWASEREYQARNTEEQVPTDTEYYTALKFLLLLCSYRDCYSTYNNFVMNLHCNNLTVSKKAKVAHEYGPYSQSLSWT